MGLILFSPVPEFCQIMLSTLWKTNTVGFWVLRLYILYATKLTEALLPFWQSSSNCVQGMTSTDCRMMTCTQENSNSSWNKVFTHKGRNICANKSQIIELTEFRDLKKQISIGNWDLNVYKKKFYSSKTGNHLVPLEIWDSKVYV